MILYKNTSDKKFYKVQSSVNNKEYLIEKTKDNTYDLQKANILANIETKTDILIKSLNKNSKHRQRLDEALIIFTERKTNKDIGYTLNKGDKIGLCIEDDENTLFFVVLHELAHIITPEFGHTTLFWDNFNTFV